MIYRDAGVDIDTGNALVEAIGPLVAATTHTGTLGSLGGFGGLFDLKALPKNPSAEIDFDAFALPPVFAWLRREARLPREEMLRTFKCGIGIVLIVAPRDTGRVLETLDGETRVIGAIVDRRSGAPIRYAGDFARSAS